MKDESIPINSLLFYRLFNDLFTFGNKRFIKYVKPKIYINHNVLDAGCGIGDGLNFLYQDTMSKHHGSGKYIGIDASIEMIEYAKIKHIPSPIEFIRGNIDNMPFGDRFFNHILCSFLFHHLPLEIKETAVKEISRVLKPGGYLMYIDFGKPHSLYAKIVTNLFTRHFEHIGSQVNNEVFTMLLQEGFVMEYLDVKTVLNGSVYCVRLRKDK